MALIKFSGEQFSRSMEPGIVSLVVSTIESKLEAEVNSLVKRVFEELQKELPDSIKSEVHRALSPHEGGEFVKIEVEVDWRDRK